MTLSLIDTTSGAGDNLKAGGDKINAALRQIDSRAKHIRAPKIAIIGNSQSSNLGGLGVGSAWFWAQVRNPRLYDYNFLRFSDTTGNVQPTGEQNLARSGSRSGPYSGYAGSPTGGGSPGLDTNSPTVIAGLKLINPDIIACLDGITNDTGSVTRTESYLNIKNVIDQVGAPKNVIFSSPPRSPGYGVGVHYFNSMMRYRGSVDSSLIFVDVAPVMLDPTTDYAPIGGQTGSASALTDDGLHYSILGARLTAPLWDAAMEKAGVPLTSPLIAHLGNVYNASTQPFGNFLGTKGAFIGVAGTHTNANSTGEVATGWNVRNYGADVKVAASKSTLVYNGITHTAQQFDFSTAAATTGVQTIEFTLAGGFAHPAGISVMISMLMQIVNLVGCTGVAVQFSSNTNGVVNMGSYGNGGTAAQNLPANLNEVLAFLFPGTKALPAGGAGGVTFSITFAPGTPAGALGTVKLASAVVAPIPAAY